MSVEHLPLRLAEIEPADDANMMLMGSFQNIAEHVAALRQLRAGVMKLGLGGVVGYDAAHTEQQHIRSHIGKLIDQPLCIKRRIGLPQICLNPANRLGHPPTLLREQQAARHE